MQTEENRVQITEPGREAQGLNGSSAPAMPTTSRFAPTSLEQAMRLAEMLADSTVVPKDFAGKPGNIVAAVVFGAELGLGVMASLQGIAVINGRPSLWGDAMLALCKAHPKWEWCEETFDKGDGKAENFAAVCVVKRKGEPPVRQAFSIKDAERAGLWKKAGPWTLYPQRMLQLRARAFALRNSFPDALKGIASAEESADIPVEHEVTSSTPLKGTAGLKAKLGIEEPRMPESQPQAQPVVAEHPDHADVPPDERGAG